MADEAPPAARRASRTFKFTMERLMRLPPHDPRSRSRSTEYTDTAEPGLKFVISAGGRNFAHRGKLDGRPRYAPLGPFPSTSVEEGRRRAHERNVAIFEGRDPDAARQRLREAPLFKAYVIAHYLPWAEQRKRSVKSDKSKFALRLYKAFGNRRMVDVTTADIREYLLGLTAAGLKPGSVDRERSLLSSVFRHAQEGGVIGDLNPCKLVRPLNVDNARTRFLSDDEVRRLVKVLRTSKIKPAADYVLLLLLTALRRSEGLNLRWEDFNAATGHLRLSQNKSGRVRFVSINKAACALIEGLPSKGKSEWLFPGADPKKHYAEPKKAFQSFLKAAGITEHTVLHDLRHSAASILCNNGASLFEVQTILGHSTPKMSQRYAHMLDDTQRKAAQKIDDAIEKMMAAAA